MHYHKSWKEHLLPNLLHFCQIYNQNIDRQKSLGRNQRCKHKFVEKFHWFLRNSNTSNQAHSIQTKKRCTTILNPTKKSAELTRQDTNQQLFSHFQDFGWQGKGQQFVGHYSNNSRQGNQNYKFGRNMPSLRQIQKDQSLHSQCSK